MITKSQIKNWRTSYNFFHLIQGNGKYRDMSEELRVYACEVYIEKFFNFPKGFALALHDAMFIADAKDEQSQKLLLGKLVTDEVILKDGPFEHLFLKIKPEIWSQFVEKLNYEEEIPFFQ